MCLQNKLTTRHQKPSIGKDHVIGQDYTLEIGVDPKQKLGTKQMCQANGRFGVLDPEQRVEISTMDSHMFFQMLFTVSVGGAKPTRDIDASTKSMGLADAGRSQANT